MIAHQPTSRRLCPPPAFGDEGWKTCTGVCIVTGQMQKIPLFGVWGRELKNQLGTTTIQNCI